MAALHQGAPGQMTWLEDFIGTGAKKPRFSIDIRSLRISRKFSEKVQLSLIGSPPHAFQ